MCKTKKDHKIAKVPKLDSKGVSKTSSKKKHKSKPILVKHIQ